MELPTIIWLRFEIIYVEDPKIRGFSAWFNEFLNIIAEGTTKEEARENLKSAMFDILKHNKFKKIVFKTLSKSEVESDRSSAYNYLF